MPRDDHSRIVPDPGRVSPLERVRAAYYRHSPRSRLLAGLVAVTVVTLVAFVTGVPVMPAVAVTVAALAVVAALMRSSDAVATTLVGLAWLVVAYPLFQIPIRVADSAVLLGLPVLVLLVSLAATRIAEFPVWHTTLLSLLVALIVGLAVALTGMLTDAVPPPLGVACAACAAGLALVWRAVAAYRLRRSLQTRDASAGARAGGASPPPTRGASAVPRQRATERKPDGGAGAPRDAHSDADTTEPAVPVDEALAELEGMIGLEPVKQQVRAIAASIEAARLRADAGYSVDRPLRHFVFTGPPGTGKTSVARTLATIFHSFGLLPTSRVIEAQRADLVGEYLGATAIKTNELLDRALGGVLFVDEAYSLVNSGDGQPDRFGNEAVQTLLKRAEDDRDQLVIILAGYEQEMEQFLTSNPGLSSRFSTRVTFPSFTPDELRCIAETLFEQRGDTLHAEAGTAMRRRFEQAAQREAIDDLGNGRFVRSLVEKAAEARDVRVVTSVTGTAGQGRPEPDELVTVRAEDIVAAYDELTGRLSGFGATPDVTEALAELDGMIGLEPVKRQVRSIIAQLRVARLREEQGLRNQPPMRHFVFTGPPGTGKTTVARILGRVFAALGLLSRAEVVEAQRSDLVGEHLGATAIKTGKLVDRALGGVLFVDEAYSLANPGYSGGDAFGSEAIQTLLKRAEDDRSRLVVVLAGYPAEMERFLASNSGLSSRFNVRVGFPSYTPEELTRIAEDVAERAGDVFDASATEDLHRIFGYVCAEGWIDELGNGRFARTLFEKACSHRDLRVAQELDEGARNAGADVGVGAEAATAEADADANANANTATTVTAAELTVVTSADVRGAYDEVTQG